MSVEHRWCPVCKRAERVRLTRERGWFECVRCGTAFYSREDGTTKAQRDAHMPRDRFLDTGRERTMG